MSPNQAILTSKKQPVFTNPKEALFFVLHYLKSYPTLENMALYFNVDIRTVSDYLKITKKSLKAALKAQDVFVNKVFKSQSDFDKAFEGVEDLIVDCTEIPIQRPDNQKEQQGYYSGKKTTYGKNVDD
nr:transposase [Rhodoflexus caldus]